MRGGRARWMIENETFNTLKNQGYQYEHNFGHGKKNLSVNLSLLMMLAFAVDQILQRACLIFKAALKKAGSKKALWRHIQGAFISLFIKSYAQILEFVAGEIKAPILCGPDTS